MNTSGTVAADVALARLLDVLATILLPLDVTPLRLAQLARASFVRASVSGARVGSSGRPHIARIAAATGLSRLEVKKIVGAQFVASKLEPDHAPRALRVARAWQTSGTYSKNGKPKVLRITGAPPSFESLCKQFSGDIPHKVILDDLARRRMIKLVKHKGAVSLSTGKIPGTYSPRDLEALEYAAALLASLASSENVLVRRSETILASSEVSEVFAQQAIAERLNSVLDSLPSLFARRGRKARNRETAHIFALVSRPKPTTR
jgi:hypothetical protein